MVPETRLEGILDVEAYHIQLKCPSGAGSYLQVPVEHLTRPEDEPICLQLTQE